MQLEQALVIAEGQAAVWEARAEATIYRAEAREAPRVLAKRGAPDRPPTLLRISIAHP